MWAFTYFVVAKVNAELDFTMLLAPAVRGFYQLYNELTEINNISQNDSTAYQSSAQKNSTSLQPWTYSAHFPTKASFKGIPVPITAWYWYVPHFNLQSLKTQTKPINFFCQFLIFHLVVIQEHLWAEYLRNGLSISCVFFSMIIPWP